MATERLKIVAGLDTNRTPALNQAALSQTQCVRYMPDGNSDGLLVQKIGGWAKYYPNQIGSQVRALWPWNDQNDNSHLGFGADEQLGIITSGSLNDITPHTLDSDVPTHFVTSAGSSLVEITDGGNFTGTTTAASGDGTTATLLYSGTDHIYPVGSSINVSGVTPTGFNGNYVVTASSAGSVSYESTATGPQTIAGSIVNESSVTQFDAVYVMTPVSVGGLTIFGLYSCIPDTSSTYNIRARDIFGAQQAAVWSTTSQTTTVTSGTGTSATLTFTGPYTFAVGSMIYVSGVTPTAYNGWHLVTASTATTVSFDSTATGAMSVAGTVSNYGAVAMFTMDEGEPEVIVTFYNHGLSVGDGYTMPVATYANGIELFGEYTVVDVIDNSQFIIRFGSNASGARTTAGTGTGATATLTFSNPNGLYNFPVGSKITVTGVTPSGFNTAAAVVTASTSTTVSYASVETGPQTVAGSIWLADEYIPQNEGYVSLQYLLGANTATSGAGFGVGGFGSGGFGVGTAPAPPSGVAIETFDWFLDNWGSILIATPNISGADDYGSPIYYYDPTQSAQAASVIVTGPVKCNGSFVAMPQRQIVAWGATFDGIQDHLLVAWSDVNNFFVWADQPSNQAGSYRIPRGSRVIGAGQGPQQGLVWTDIALWSMQYIGQPDIYGFNEVAIGCGLIAPKAWGILHGVVYWMSQSQFFIMGGDGVKVLDCPLWDMIFQQIDSDNLVNIRSAPNSRFNEIGWFIPIAGSDGENGLFVKYNAHIGQWDASVTPLTRSAWTNQSILGAPIGSGTDRYIYMHESMNGETLLNADTAAMTASFRTGMFALSEGDMMSFLDQWWPDMKWGLYGGVQSANVKFTFYVYNYPGDTAVVHGPYTMTQAKKYFTPRFRGRLVEMEVSSSDIDSFWRTGANRYRIMADGKF